MTYSVEQVRLLWKAHVTQEFPARLRGLEVDGVQIVLLDADVAGLVESWLASAGGLSAGRAGTLARCKADLARVLVRLSDQAEIEYLAGLAGLVDAMSADESNLLSLSEAYERAEARFLWAVAEGADRHTLSELADAVALAAESQLNEASRALHAGEDGWMPLGELVEAAEQLAGLWADLAAAYAGRPFQSENGLLN